MCWGSHLSLFIELSLKTYSTLLAKEMQLGLFGDHCYLWGIGRKGSTMENLEKIEDTQCSWAESDSSSFSPSHGIQS